VSWGASLPTTRNQFLIFNGPGTSAPVAGNPGANPGNAALTYFTVPKKCRAIAVTVSADVVENIGEFRLFRWHNGGASPNQHFQTFKLDKTQAMVAGGGTAYVDLREVPHTQTFHKRDVAGVQWTGFGGTTSPGKITVSITFEVV
jgi:hypothetical protein